MLWIVSGAILVVILLLLSFVVYVFYGNANSHTRTGQQTATVPTGQQTTLVPTTASTPTIIVETPTLASSTPLPTRTIPYYANDIYNEFVANGLGGPDVKQDANWSCCTYVPAGGALYWTDNQSGHSISIATFYNNADAETDATDLINKGFNASVVHSCLLSYDRNVPTGVINSYVQVMQQYCI